MAISNDTIQKLGVLLASWTVFYQKAHTYHWDLTGNEFLSFHKHLESLYGESVEHTDEIAERIRQFGVKTAFTLGEASSKSVVSDNNSANELKAVAKDLMLAIVQLTSLQTEIFNESDGQGDYVTADLMTQLSKWCEFNSWFLASIAGEENKTNM